MRYQKIYSYQMQFQKTSKPDRQNLASSMRYCLLKNIDGIINPQHKTIKKTLANSLFLLRFSTIEQNNKLLGGWELLNMAIIRGWAAFHLTRLAVLFPIKQHMQHTMIVFLRILHEAGVTGCQSRDISPRLINLSEQNV